MEGILRYLNRGWIIDYNIIEKKDMTSCDRIPVAFIEGLHPATHNGISVEFEIDLGLGVINWTNIVKKELALDLLTGETDVPGIKRKSFEVILNEDYHLDFWKEEMQKCIKSPYYFYTTYVIVNNQPATTRLSKEEFNKLFNGKG